jgi:hypothetical protein
MKIRNKERLMNGLVDGWIVKRQVRVNRNIRGKKEE